jgi:preprotein translocase subunit SecA
MYKKLAGMTGTAITEAAEFDSIYRLDVVVIPTNRPLIRTEYADVVFGTEQEKFDAIEEEIVRQHGTGRPLLVGTISIEKSELLSERLKRRGIKHEVLNAKHHEREAQIIAKAGQLANVTISTNMAGRGTDIVLGTFDRARLIEHWKKHGLAPEFLDPNLSVEKLREKLVEHWTNVFLDEKTRERVPRSEWEAELRGHWEREGLPPLTLTERVADLWGLHVVGTERHEARRIDNQLRGRAGRQGDPGSSRFFLSLQDDLMRIFASDWVGAILRRIGMSKGMALEHPMVTRSIERAQRKVEEHNFEIRKHLLEYDEVMDEHRKAIYGQRQAILESESVKETLLEWAENCLLDEIDRAVPGNEDPELRNFRPLAEWARGFGAALESAEWRQSSYEKLRGLFAERAADAAATGATGQAAAPAPRLFARGALALFCDREEMFRDWDLNGLEVWARSAEVLGRGGATVPADALRARLTDAVIHCCDSAAREAYQDADIEQVLEILIGEAVARFLPPSEGLGEWNLDGLAAWANAIGISLPVNQWKRDESEEEEGPEFEQSRREEIRRRIGERARSQLKGATPAEVVARRVQYEARKLLSPASEEEAGGYAPLAAWLSRALRVPVSEADIREAVSAEADKVEGEIAQHAERAGHNRAPAESAKACFRDLFDAFMLKDLSRPARDLTRLAFYVHRKYGVQALPFELSKLTVDDVATTLLERIKAVYEQREQQITSEKMRIIEKFLLLQKLDLKWKDHLYAMDHLKSGIGMRGYAQVDPKVEYTREARKMFDEMQASLHEEVTDLILKLDIRSEEERGPVNVWRDARASHPEAAAEAAGFQRQQATAVTGSQGGEEKPRPIVAGARVGRNDPCPCGSGKKYKNCCGRAR